MVGTILNNLDEVFEDIKLSQFIVASVSFLCGVVVFGLSKILDNKFYKGSALLVTGAFMFVSIGILLELLHL